MIFISLLTFIAMEFVAWFTHKYIMHGLLWYFHKDHHQGSPGFFEKNDFFFLIFAIPSWLGIMLGMLYALPSLVAIGIGILVYGFCYFLIHDVLIHRRFNWFGNTKNSYLRGIRKAHYTHHRYKTKEGGECFGMLIVPMHFFKVSSKVK